MSKLSDLLRGRGDPHLARLYTYVAPFRTKILLSVLFLAVAGGSASLIAVFLGKLTDLGFYQQAERWLIAAAPFGLVAVTAVNSFCMFLSTYLLEHVSQGALARLRSELFARALTWPAAVVQENRTSFVKAKFVNEANAALAGAAQALIQIVRNLMQIAGLIVTLLWYSWELTLVTLFLAPAVAWILKLISKSIRGSIGTSQTLVAQTLSRVSEAIDAADLIKICGTYREEERKFAKINEGLRDVTLYISRWQLAGTPLTQFVTMIAVAVVVAAAMALSQAGQMTLGEFVTFISAMILLMGPIRQLTNLNSTFTTMSMASESLFRTLDQKPEEETGTKVFENVRGEVDFEHVCLRYPGTETDAVHDFSLHVPAGTSVALVGLSGSGKSSLVSLIPRFWDATGGVIRVDGEDCREYTRASLRDQISVVSQNVFLFEGSIRANILYGRPDASEEDLRRAVDAAALTEFVESLPKGLDTPVGEAGDLLSGGQRQRISIARALLRDTPILILDEATSALDSISEHHVKQALERLMEGRTSFTVAHRLSTVSSADCIVVMDHGRIVEIGTHAELLAQGGLYRQLCDLQSEAGRRSDAQS